MQLLEAFGWNCICDAGFGWLMMAFLLKIPSIFSNFLFGLFTYKK